MQKRLMFIAGAGLGYVLGARAGQDRYRQITTQAEKVWSDPRVQDKVSLAQAKVQEKAPVVQERAQSLAANAQSKAAGTAAQVKAKVSKDHSGSQIGVEPTSDVEPTDVKFESGR